MEMTHGEETEAVEETLEGIAAMEEDLDDFLENDEANGWIGVGAGESVPLIATVFEVNGELMETIVEVM